jgi:hypothetical protein
MTQTKVAAAQPLDVIGAIVALSQVYATFDQDAACARGWCLNQYGDGMIGIVKDDDSDVFAGADQAHEHVAISSVMSPDAGYRDLCAKALRIEAASIAIRDAIPEEID